MQAVVLIDAAPGYEEAVEASLRKVRGITRVARFKDRNYDLAILVQGEDAALVERVVNSEIRMITGISGVERIPDPSKRLLDALSR